MSKFVDTIQALTQEAMSEMFAAEKVQDQKQMAKAYDRYAALCAASSALMRMEKRSENYRRQKGIIPRNNYTKSGICYLCNKPAIEGKKTCEEHYAVLRERMLHARACRTEQNYFEKANELFWQK